MKKKWQAHEITSLRKLVKEGRETSDISDFLGRSVSSVEHKIAREKLTRPEPVSWTINLDYEEIGRLIKDNLFEVPCEVRYSKKTSHSEEAVLLLSDMHVGMINKSPLNGRETYNENVRRKEFQYLRNSVFNIHALLNKSFKLDTLHIFLLGDLITNDRIFEGQKFEISSCVGNQMWIAIADITNFINEMKKRFAKINIVGVVGNHSRSVDRASTEEPVENNFEYHIYKVLELVFKSDPRVNIIVPSTRIFTYEIFGHRYMLSHGDNFRGLTRNYMERAAKDILVALPKDFDVYTMGHFHRCESIDLSERSVLLVNGSFIPQDAYGFKMFKQLSTPRQWLFGVSRKRPLTFWYRVSLLSPIHG